MRDGKIIPKIKVSENVDKITIPHFKKTYRIFDNATGKAEADYITVWDETVDESAPLELFDPRATWKRKTYTNFTAKPLAGAGLPGRRAGLSAARPAGDPGLLPCPGGYPVGRR